MRKHTSPHNREVDDAWVVLIEKMKSGGKSAARWSSVLNCGRDKPKTPSSVRWNFHPIHLVWRSNPIIFIVLIPISNTFTRVEGNEFDILGLNSARQPEVEVQGDLKLGGP